MKRRWVVINAGEGGQYFDSEEEAVGAAESILEYYRDDAKFSEWDTAVEWVFVAEIIYAPEQTNIDFDDGENYVDYRLHKVRKGEQL